MPLERFLNELDQFLAAQEHGSATGAAGAAPAQGWAPLDVRVHSVARERTGPQSGFEVTFPQGMLWAILVYEGAIWRGFTPAEMLLPCAILLLVGTAAFALGAYRFRSLA